MELTWVSYLLVGLAAMAAGAVNALAGGGTLITFPMLTAVGLGALPANVTNTVALCPGYLGATLAQWKDLGERKRLLKWYIPAAVLGGVLGGVLLMISSEKVFRQLVPYLILAASALLAAAEPLRAWVLRRTSQGSDGGALERWATPALGLAAVYGGYFGAGLSVIILAVLGLLVKDSLTRLNALKQVLAFATNLSAAVFFLFSGSVNWPVALVMMVFALIGGNLGGRLAGKIKPATLRMVVVVIGVIVAILYFIKG